LRHCLLYLKKKELIFIKKVSKILAVLLILALCLPFAFACGGDDKNSGGNEESAETPVAETSAEESVVEPVETPPEEPVTEAPTVPQTMPIPEGVAPQSLYTDTEPSGRGTWGRYNLGLEFQTNADGVVSQLKAYVLSGQFGEMTLRLYDNREKELVTFTFEADGGDGGWITFDLAEPLYIQAGYYAVALSSAYDKNGGNLFAWASGKNIPSGSENMTFLNGLYEVEDYIEFYPINEWSVTDAPGADLVFYPIIK